MASRPTERSTITAVLKRIDFKVRFNQALHQLAVASCLVLSALVLVEVAPMLVPVRTPPDRMIVGAGSAAFLVFILWSQRGGRQLARAAGVADMRAGLNDEIKSAYWFMRQDHSSPWIEHLVRRAASTARTLDPRGLVPVAIPKRFGIALALFTLLQLLALVPSDGPLLTFAAASDSVRFERAREAYIDDLRDLIDGDDDELLDEDALALFEEALEELEAENTSIHELLRDLREARELLEEGNLEMAATRDALDELMEGLSGSFELGEFVEAMMSQDLSYAAERIRDFAERLSSLDNLELADLGDQLQEASDVDQPVINELLEALEEAADAISGDRLADAQEALDRVAAALEEIAEQQERQETNMQAADAAQAMQDALSQEDGAFSPAQTETQTAQRQLVGDESSEALMGARSSQVTLSEGESPRSQSGPAGDGTGGPSGSQMELGASTTLEAQLVLEVIDGVAQDSPEEDLELDPEDIFQEASRQQSSTVQYRDVRAPSQYSRGSALNAERIPWRYRSLVKKYFLALRPDERE